MKPFVSTQPALSHRKNLRLGTLLLLPLLFFLSIALATEFLVRELHLRTNSEQRQETLAKAGAIRAVLESELNTTAFLANGLESYIVARNGRINPRDVDAMLGLLFVRGRHFRNIGIAPGNRLQFIHPLAGNEKALGLYYPENPTQWPAVQRVISEGKGRLAGPVTLVQGGEALIYRTPVFIEDKYWGLISTVIDTGSLFKVIEPLLAEQPFQIALRGRDGEGASGSTFLGDPALFASPGALMEINIPGGSWQLAVSPTGANRDWQHRLLRFVGWLFACSFPILILILIRALHRQQATLEKLRETEAGLARHRDQLEATVQIRTRELIEAKEASEAGSRAKSTFIANMSHELRTPMHAILGVTAVLRRKSPSPEQATRLDMISTAAKHLLALINDVLDFSKIEAGKMTLNPEVFETDELGRRINALFAEQAAQKSLAFELDFSALPARLNGDLTRIVQVLVNFIGNALKFTEQGCIRILAETSGEDADSLLVHFKVIDTGIGLKGEHIERIFEAFEQGDNTTSRKFGGTGLGLAISHRLAQLMGGSTGVESSPGVGSTFWFTVRLGKSHAPEKSTASV